MKNYSLQDAQNQLQELLNQARRGEVVLIRDGKEDAFQLVPVALSNKPRLAGSARGKIQMSDDFDAPIADFDPYTSGA